MRLAPSCMTAAIAIANAGRAPTPENSRSATALAGTRAADDALALVGLQPIDSRRFIGKTAPDQKKRPRRPDGTYFLEFGNCGDLRPLDRMKLVRAHFLPMGALQHVDGIHIAIDRPQQSRARLNGAVVQHETRRSQFDRRAAGLLNDHEVEIFIAVINDERSAACRIPWPSARPIWALRF
jgi:hypothetical protein